MRKFFGKEETWDKLIKFEYFSVVIGESRGHMPVLYFGNWLPHAWLKKVWKEITGDSDIIDIRTTNNAVNDDRWLAGYVLAQYALFQEGEIRFQMSQGWTWRGMVRGWKRAVKKFTRQVRGKYVVSFKKLLVDWNDFVQRKKNKTVASYLLISNFIFLLSHVLSISSLKKQRTLIVPEYPSFCKSVLRLSSALDMLILFPGSNVTGNCFPVYSSGPTNRRFFYCREA